jgi:hypothetical protein
MKKFLFILIPGLLFLGACGDGMSSSNTDNGPEKITTDENVYQYLVKADGLVYRCFQTHDSRGGIWCTLQGKG